MSWRPNYPGDVPSLGWDIIDWIQTYLAAPDRNDGQLYELTQEQAQFLVNLYALDPLTGRRDYRRAVFSRPKGAGKSPFMAAIACAEALAPVVPDGWDANGRPVGRPWSRSRTPWVQLAAVSEDQTRNAWAPLLEMLRDGPIVDAYPGLEPMETFVNLPKGRIEFVTSQSTSREGNRPVCVILDQTESWIPSNGGVKLAATVRRNLGKTGGVSIEAPNAYVPGEGSVAEGSAEYAGRILEGRVREKGLLYDHQEAPAGTDMSERESLLAGLRIAYGDAAQPEGWVDLDRIVSEVWDPATHPQDARRYYLNQVTHASDSWISQPEWAGCFDGSKQLRDGDVIVMGFDGSQKRHYSTTDATALIGCRVSDGHLFSLGIWEEPEGPAAEEWQVPVFEVDRSVRQAFEKFTVVGFFADAARWQTQVAKWEADFAAKLEVKASYSAPVAFNLNRPRVIASALDSFAHAVAAQELTHDGDSPFTRHVLNARRRVQRGNVTIMKEHPESVRKIDAAYAAMLAWVARIDAVSAGLGVKKRRKSRRLVY